MHSCHCGTMVPIIKSCLRTDAVCDSVARVSHNAFAPEGAVGVRASGQRMTRGRHQALVNVWTRERYYIIYIFISYTTGTTTRIMTRNKTNKKEK